MEIIKREQCGYCQDTWFDGCGLSESEYNTTKSKMLKSIKNNGGFYIGKYETGFYLEEGNTNYRREENHDTTENHKACIRKDLFPYNMVTCSQAENLAKGFATKGKTSSLLFGVQWDLVLRYIKEKENLSDNTLLTSNSTTWGNYFNSTFNITNTNAWHSSTNVYTWEKGIYNKTSEGRIVLTTGASDDFVKQNIYDLAGNMMEWTLEQAGEVEGKTLCSLRGGVLQFDGETFPVSAHFGDYITDYGAYMGFRVAIY